MEKCEGIVIRAVDYGETNKIVTLWTREFGKVAVMARGAKKPNSRHSSVTQVFTYGTFLMKLSRGIGVLHQAEIIKTFRLIREDLLVTTYASIVMELIDKITEEKSPNPYLFELLSQTLNYMNEGFDLDVLLFIFELKMIPVMGLHLHLDGCAMCGKSEGEFGFSIREAGFICQRCVEYDVHYFKISATIVKLLRLFYYFDLTRLGEISLKNVTKRELEIIIHTYYDEYSGLTLKSKKFLKQMKELGK